MAEHVVHTTEHEGGHVRHVVHILTAGSIVYSILDLIEVLLALRLVLKLFGANTGNAIVSVFYSATGPLVAPFVSMFPNANTVFEWGTVISMLAYAILAYLIVRLFSLE